MKRLLLFLLISTSLLGGCFKVPTDFTQPSWDVDLNLPLINRYYTLDKIIKTDKYIHIGANNVVVITDSVNLNKEGIADFIKGRMDTEYPNLDIPIFNGEGTITIDLANGIYLDSAYFSSGIITLEINNSSSSQLKFQAILPGFIKNSQPMTVDMTVGPAQKGSQDVNMAGYAYSSSGMTDKNKLTLIGKILEGNVGQKVTVTVKIKNTMFDYVSGKIPTLNLNPIVRSTTLPITDDIKGFRDKFKFYKIKMEINGEYLRGPSNTKNFGMSIKNLYVSGKRKDGTSINLNKLKNDNLGPVDMVGTTISLPLDQDNSNVSDFLSFMPDSIVIKAEPVINPNNTDGIATSRDSIQFKFNLYIESDLSIDNANLKDTLNLSEGDSKLDDNTRKQLKNANYVELTYKIKNKLGLEITLISDVLDSLNHKMFTIDTIHVAGAKLKASGESDTEIETISTVYLNNDEIQKLANANGIITNLYLSSTGGQRAVMNSKDWVSVISYISVGYHIKPEDKKESK